MDFGGEIFDGNLVTDLEILRDDHYLDPGAELVPVAIVHVIVLKVRAQKSSKDVSHFF